MIKAKAYTLEMARLALKELRVQGIDEAIRKGEETAQDAWNTIVAYAQSTAIPNDEFMDWMMAAWLEMHGRVIAKGIGVKP